MSGSNSDAIGGDILRVFDRLDDPCEPLATREIADRVGCSRRTAYAELRTLAESGKIASKRIGARARAWWRPQSTTEQRSPEHAPDSQPTPSANTWGRGIERVIKPSPVGIVVVGPSGRISFANGRAQEVLGLERDEITSRTYRQPEWNIYYDDGTPIPEEEHPVTRVLERGEPDYGFEHWIELPDGTERWLSSNAAPVLNEQGDVAYAVVGFEDATDLKKREDTLTSDKRRLLELRSEQLFEPFLEEATGTVQIDVDEIVTLPDETALQYVTATGISAKTLADVFEHRFAVLDVRLLSSTEEHSRFEIHVEAPSVPLVFDSFGGTVTSLIRCDDDNAPVLTGELPGDVDPRAVLREAWQIYSDIELVSQELRYTPRLLHDVVKEELTDRQWMALRTAYWGSYFKTPRASSGDELADQLGVTRQTFNQHLRKAEQAVFELLFEASGKEAR